MRCRRGGRTDRVSVPSNVYRRELSGTGSFLRPWWIMTSLIARTGGI